MKVIEFGVNDRTIEVSVMQEWQKQGL